MKLKPTMIIFSVYQTSHSEGQNELNHMHTTAMLDKAGVPYKVVYGVYKGESEKSLVVPMEGYVGLVREICLLYNQECYLELGADRSAFLTYMSAAPKSEYLGRLIYSKVVPKVDSYTYDPATSGYFYTDNS